MEVGDRALRDIRPSQNQGNPGRFFIHGEFAEQSATTQGFPVVGGVENPGVIRESGRVQRAARSDHGRFRGANEVYGHARFSYPVGDLRVFSDGAYGVGTGRLHERTFARKPLRYSGSRPCFWIEIIY